MKKIALALSSAAIALAAGASPAAAQNARETHFDGPYISGVVGMSAQGADGRSVRFDTDGDGNFDDAVTTTTGANAFSPGFCNGNSGGVSPASPCIADEGDDVEFAGRIGFDKRFSENLVGGLLLEGSTSNARDRVTAYSTTPARYTLGREIDFAVSLRGRLGFTPGGGALFYVTGGPSFAKIEHTFQTTNTANAFRKVDEDKWVFGGQVGGGAEIMVTDNISLGLEYLFNRYDDDKYSVEVTQGTAPATNPFLLNGGSTNMRPSYTNLEFHSLRASVSYQF
jgi:outer membrane immunogenic protein